MRQKCGLSHLTATPQKNLSPFYLADLDAYAGSWHYSMSKRIPEVQREKHMVEELPPPDPCHIQLSFCETSLIVALLLLAAAPTAQRSLQEDSVARVLSLGLTLLLSRATEARGHFLQPWHWNILTTTVIITGASFLKLDKAWKALYSEALKLWCDSWLQSDNKGQTWALQLILQTTGVTPDH